jgi:hypothetical protein
VNARSSTRLVAVVALLSLACASTQETDQETYYWQARGSFVAAHEAYNDFLRVIEKPRAEAGKPTLMSSTDRKIAEEVIEAAQDIIAGLEGKIGDDRYAEDVMLGIGRLGTMTMRLVVILDSARRETE